MEGGVLLYHYFATEAEADTFYLNWLKKKAKPRGEYVEDFCEEPSMVCIQDRFDYIKTSDLIAILEDDCFTSSEEE